MSEWNWDSDFDWHEPLDTTVIELDAAKESDQSAGKSKSRRALGAVALVAAIFGSGFMTGHYLKNPNHKQSVTTAASARLVGCPTVPAEEINKVRRLVNTPTNPQLIKAENSGFYQSYVNKEATKSGFRLVSGQQLIERLYNQDPAPKQTLKYLNNYTRQFGFKVSLYANDSNSKLGGLTAVDLNTIDRYAFNTGAESLIVMLHLLPPQVVKAAHFKHLRIVDSFVSGAHEDNVAADAGNGVINIALQEFYAGNPDLYRHELGHLEDAAFCGVFGYEYYDPQYQSLNPPDFEYGTEPFVNSPWRGVTVSQYGTSNIQEDKAEMYCGVLGPLDDDNFAYSPYAVIRKKEDLLLARLDEKVPGIVKYLAAISIKQP